MTTAQKTIKSMIKGHTGKCRVSLIKQGDEHAVEIDLNGKAVTSSLFIETLKDMFAESGIDTEADRRDFALATAEMFRVLSSVPEALSLLLPINNTEKSDD